MVRRYGLYGARSRDFLTCGGRILVHPNRAEMEWLLRNVRVREVPRSVPDKQTMPLAAHPQLAGVRFPLNRKDFAA